MLPRRPEPPNGYHGWHHGQDSPGGRRRRAEQHAAGVSAARSLRRRDRPRRRDRHPARAVRRGRHRRRRRHDARGRWRRSAAPHPGGKPNPGVDAHREGRRRRPHRRARARRGRLRTEALHAARAGCPDPGDSAPGAGRRHARRAQPTVVRRTAGPVAGEAQRALGRFPAGSHQHRVQSAGGSRAQRRAASSASRNCPSAPSAGRSRATTAAWTSI